MKQVRCLRKIDFVSLTISKLQLDTLYELDQKIYKNMRVYLVTAQTGSDMHG